MTLRIRPRFWRTFLRRFAWFAAGLVLGWISIAVIARHAPEPEIMIAMVVGAAIGTLIAVSFRLSLDELIVESGVVSGPRSFMRRGTFATSRLDRDASARRNWWQRANGYRVLRSMDGDRVVLVPWQFDPPEFLTFMQALDSELDGEVDGI